MRNVQCPSQSFRHRTKKYRFAVSIMLLLAMLLFALFQLEQKMWPVASKIIEYQCRSLAVTTIQKTCNKILSENPAEYQNLYTIRYTENGKIQSIVGNTACVNGLEDSIVDEVNAVLQNTDQMALSIPIGNLTGLSIFNNLGPAVNVRIVPLALATSQITSRFTDSGVNQTKLEVFIHIEADVSAMLAGKSNAIHVENDICIAQIIIVGDTPLVYSE